MEVVKEEGTAVARQVPAEEVRGAAWQVLRVVAEDAAAAPRVERRAHGQWLAAEPRPRQAPAGDAGVRAVEAVVLLAVATYFVAGLAGVLAS